MSFFDEADEAPPTEVRSSSRSTPRRRGSRTGGGGSGGSGRSGGGSRRRPPARTQSQSILARRAVAVVAVIVVIVLIAVGVDSCEGSARRSALRDYANGVNAVITRSQTTSDSLFKALQGGAANATDISNSVDATEKTAASVLSQAKGLSAPSSVRTAQSRLVFAMQMRLDGITTIAQQIQAALGSSARTSAVNDIATAMAQFYASDVVYKTYTAPDLVAALHANSIGIGGSDGVPVSSLQFLPSLQWLTPSDVASRLGVAISSGGNASSTTKNGTGGLRGHSLTSVSVDGTALSGGSTNSIAASPAPTFTLNFENGGNFNEFDVTCQVKVTGTSDSGTKVVAETYAGKPASCDVALSSAPPKGDYTVVATIEKVPGEANLQNNTLSFPVTFH